jgi:hypothetical protein
MILREYQLNSFNQTFIFISTIVVSKINVLLLKYCFERECVLKNNSNIQNYSLIIQNYSKLFKIIQNYSKLFKLFKLFIFSYYHPPYSHPTLTFIFCFRFSKNDV